MYTFYPIFHCGLYCRAVSNYHISSNKTRGYHFFIWPSTEGIIRMRVLIEGLYYFQNFIYLEVFLIKITRFLHGVIKNIWINQFYISFNELCIKIFRYICNSFKKDYGTDWFLYLHCKKRAILMINVLKYCPRGYIEGRYYFFIRPSTSGIIRVRFLFEGGSFMRKYGIYYRQSMY